jgi:type 1 fimbriae regulatory protein FimB/type 1 fimbriae regulatory protein FimE
MSKTAVRKAAGATASTIESGTVVRFPGTGGDADFVTAVRAAGASVYSDAVARCQASEPISQEEQEQAEAVQRRRPRKPAESEDRRPYLTETEVSQLCEAARKRGRYGHRDATMILMAYRHGLRVSELVALQWGQVDLDAGRLQVVRRKGSDDSVQPLSGVELRALRKIRRDQEAGLRHVFVSERGAPFTANGFFKTLSRAAAAIGMGDVHPHLLRHGTGFKLVNDGVDTRTLAAYLGHRNMANTARYTKMNAKRFDGFWQD